jgi:hypothetical protein
MTTLLSNPGLIVGNRRVFLTLRVVALGRQLLRQDDALFLNLRERVLRKVVLHFETLRTFRFEPRFGVPVALTE